MQNVVMVNPNKLVISSVHNELYGTEEDFESSLLFQTIQSKGILTPLIVDPNFIVVSGVMRLRIALSLNMDTVPVLFTSNPLEDYQVALLNVSRQKLPSVVLKEYELLKPLFIVGKGKRTDLTGETPILCHKETLGTSKSTVQRLCRIDNYAVKVHGSKESDGYKKMWRRLDVGDYNASKLEKSLKKKVMALDSNTPRHDGDYIKPGFVIFNSDSANLFQLDDASIQVVITSPPYFSVKDYDIGDNQIGFELLPYEFTVRLAEHFDECMRVIKPKGSLFVNLGDYIVDGEYKCVPAHFAIEMAKRGWRLNDTITWAKNNPRPSQAKRTINCTESIFHFTKTAHFDYYTDWIEEFLNDEINKGFSGHFHGVNSPNKSVRSFLDFRGENVIVSNASNNHRLRERCRELGIHEIHDSTFPEILPEICIRLASREGDTVLDIFNGTASTGVVASVLKRDYFGYELNPNYILQSKVHYEDLQDVTKSHLLKSA
jgi:DNA modification methylase